MRPRLTLTIALVLGLSLLLGPMNNSADAGWRFSKRTVSSKSSRVRPVTGYGANLHRRFVLERELKRAKQGKSVRNRGNILWYRYR